MSLFLTKSPVVGDATPTLSRSEAAKRRLTIPLACDEALQKANEGNAGGMARLRHCSEVGDLVVPPSVDLFTLRPVLDPPAEPEVMPLVRWALNLAEAGVDLTAEQKAAVRHYSKARLDHLKAWVRRGVVAYSGDAKYDVQGDEAMSNELVDLIADRGDVLVELAHHIHNLSELSDLGKAP